MFCLNNGAQLYGAENHAVRPAFHLNLSKLNIIETPKITSELTYNRNEQTVSFNSDYDCTKMEITGITRVGGTAYVAPTYTNASAGSPAGTMPTIKITDAGEYEISLKSKPVAAGATKRWLFSDTGTDETTVKFTVKKAKLATPAMGTVSQEYSGEELTFTATGYITSGTTATPAYPRDIMSVAVSKTGGGVVGETLNPLTTGNLEIGVRNAGKYKATFTITETANYEWQQTGLKEIAFEVTKKKLQVSYETTDADHPNTLSWTADATTTAKFTVTGMYAGDGGSEPADTVGLQAKITKTEDAARVWTKQLTDKGDGTQEFELDASIFGGAYVPGHYPISFEFTGGTHDGNYDLTAVNNAMSNNPLVIGASGAGLNQYDWKYKTEDIALTPMPPAGTNLVYQSKNNTGVEYTLYVDDTSFADANIEVDTSYNEDGFIDGYKDNVKSRAGTYTAKVRIKVTDPTQYAFSDGSTEKVVEYTFTIDKATIDTTAIKWQYTDMNGQTQIYDPLGDGIPWKSTNYTLTLSPLPDGVTVNPGSSYSGNQAKAVGEYTASCTSLSYDTNNYNTIATPTVQWKIKAQEIEINNTSWIMDAQTATTVFYLPHLNSPYDGIGILYRYYYLDPQNGATLLNDVSEILSDGGITRNYYVEAYLSTDTSTDGVTTWDNALKLKDTTTQPNGACTMGFTTGDNRTPVSVTLNGNPVMYDGKEHGKLNEEVRICL